MNPQEMKQTFETYKLKMNQKLSELDTEIQTLKAKAAEAKAEQKQNYQEMVSDLEAKRHEMQAKLDDLGSSSEEAFERMKTGVESAWAELSTAFNKAKASF